MTTRCVSGMGGRKSQVRYLGEGLPYHMTYPMMHVMYLTPSRGQTDTCENITLPQPRLREVKIVVIYGGYVIRVEPYVEVELFIG